MPGIRTKLLKKLLRKQLSGWSGGTIEEQRDRQERSTVFLKKSTKVFKTPAEIPDVPGWWFEPPNPKPGVILYLHGGAFALGSVQSTEELISRLALASGWRILAIDYRLAPEHPFPAALDDALKSWNWLVDQGFGKGPLVLAGDSAGGGLAVSTALELRDKKSHRPSGILGFSPWLDVSLQGHSVKNKASADPYLDFASLNKYADYYCGENSRENPLISPVFAKLHGLPPTLLQCGRDEILLDDVRRFTRCARQAGSPVKMDIYTGLFHVFQLFSFLPETKSALNRVAEFLSGIPQ